MSFLFRIVTLAVLFCLVACAPKQMVEVQLPPERSFHRGFSLVPLNEQGWWILDQNHNNLALKKDGINEHESYVITTTVFGLPHSTSQQDFVNVVKKLERERLDTSRFTILKQDVGLYPKKGDYCARSHAILEDRVAVQRTGGTKAMIMDVVALFCQHPEDKDVGVWVAYSYRHFSGNEDPSLFEKAENLFETIEFRKL